MKLNYEADEALLLKFKQGDDLAMKHFMKDHWPAFRNYIVKKGCPPESAEALYVDCITQLWINIEAGKLEPPLTGGLKTYLFKIGHFLNLKQFSSSFGRHHQLAEEFPDFADPAGLDWVNDSLEKAEWLNNVLQRLEKGCRDILTLFYLKGWPGESIVEELGLPSTGAFRVKKMRCLQRLRNLIEG